MSQLCKLANKSNQSTSSFGSGLVVGDSYQTLRALVTNVATGALSGLISHSLSGSCRRLFPHEDVMGVPLRRRHPLMLILYIIPIITLITLISCSNDTYATASSITVSVTAGSGAYVNIPPTAEGKFGMAGPTTFSVSTDHISGYTLTASASNLSFTDAEGNNGTVGATYTIDNLPANTAINATEFESNSNYKNKWGYLPDKYYNTSTSATVTNNTNFFPAPITTPQTLDITTAPNIIESGETERTPNDYNLTLGTKLDHTVAQGQYTTTITLTAVANPTPYTINYYANAGSDTVTNMPTSPETSSVDGDTATLSTTIPQRPGYTFSRWCVATSVDNCYTSDNTTGAGNVYKPGGSYTLDQTQANTLNVYALWKVNPCDTTNQNNNQNPNDLLYCKVQNQLKRQANGLGKTQTLADMQAVITEPTSSDPATDTSNSGVYEYDPDSNGIASDANNDYNIYYFRGILDSQFAESDDWGGIPSTGNSGYYQNYVKLAGNDTCWRIVRTTGSGGIKMIYNGTWTGSSCANGGESAKAFNTYFNKGKVDEGSDAYGTLGFVVYVGYNYDSKYGYNNTGYTSLVDNDDLFSNEVPSNVRTQIENWYANTLIGYTAGFETSAGWCDDRSAFTWDAGGRTAVFQVIPYRVMDDVLFGTRERNTVIGNKLSLWCPNITGYDLLTTSNGLGQPIALLTEDEAVLVGHGYYHGMDTTVVTKYSSNYSYSSFLRSGHEFWLLSPNGRYSGTRVSDVDRSGYTGDLAGIVNHVNVRPTVSLVTESVVLNGSGAVDDPWVVNAPSN